MYKQSFYVIFLFVVLLGSAATLWAFSEPTSGPPAGNVRPPINQTDVRQDKRDVLGSGGDLGVKDLYLGVGTPPEGDIRNVDEIVGYGGSGGDLILRGAPGNLEEIFIEGNPVIINNDPPNASVGIGISPDPAYKLDVWGGTRIRNNGTAGSGVDTLVLGRPNASSKGWNFGFYNPGGVWDDNNFAIHSGWDQFRIFLDTDNLNVCSPPALCDRFEIWRGDLPSGSPTRVFYVRGDGNVYLLGKIGIGMENPTQSLEVLNGNIKLASNPSGVGQESRIIMQDDNDYIYKRDQTNPGVEERIGISMNGSDMLTINTASAPGGGVGIGTTNPLYKLEVNGSAAKPGGGSWTDSSDVRLKKNIEPLRGALDKLLGLHGVTFEWKDPVSHGNLFGIQMGMIAQEVEKIFPQWIGENASGYKDLTFRGFEALTVEAMRELRQENESLKEYNNALEARIQALEQRINGGIQ